MMLGMGNNNGRNPKGRKFLNTNSKCKTCGKGGHQTNECYHAGKECTICGRNNHVATACFHKTTPPPPHTTTPNRRPNTDGGEIKYLCCGKKRACEERVQVQRHCVQNVWENRPLRHTVSGGQQREKGNRPPPKRLQKQQQQQQAKHYKQPSGSGNVPTLDAICGCFQKKVSNARHATSQE